MRRRSVILAALFLTFAGAGYWVSVYVLQSSPRVEAPAVVNLGRHTLGQQVVVGFPVRNLGRQPLRLSRFETSCGCLSLDQKNMGRISADDELIVAPFDELEIRATLSTRGLAGGNIRDTVRFRTNDPVRGIVLVELVAELESEPIVAIPTQLSIPDAVVGTNISRTITLRVAQGHEGFRLRSIKNPLPEIIKSIKTIPLNRQAAAGGSASRHTQDVYEVVLTLQAPADAINSGGILEIVGEDDKKLKVPISINVVSPIRLIPSVLYLPRQSESGPVFQAACLCKASGTEIIKITALDIPKGFHFQGDRKSQASGQVVFKVSCLPEALTSGGDHILRFQIDHSQGTEVIELAVRSALERHDIK
jgi:hypothetical protein